MFDYACDALQRLRQGRRISDLSEMAVEDKVALICDEGGGALLALTQDWISPETFEPFLDGTSGERDDFDRQWKAAQLLDDLVFVRHDHQAVRSGRHDLLVQQSSSPSLDQGQSRSHFVSAINGDVGMVHLVETGQRDAKGLRELRAGTRGRNTPDLQSFTDLLAEKLNGKCSGGTGS